MRNFIPFPILNDYLYNSINYNKENYEFSFLNEEQNVYDSIKVDADQDPIILNDGNHRWIYKQNNFRLKKNVKINPKKLFGINGITTINSRLGLAIFWMSKKTMTRGIKKITTFDKNDEVVEAEAILTFDKKMIRDEMEVQIILYLDHYVEEKDGSQDHFANIEGTKLGVLDSTKLVLSGTGSLFPTVSINDKNEPLWRVEMSLDLEKQVEEGVNLIVNEGHKKVGVFDISNQEDYNPDFIEEVLINVVFQIIINAITSKEYIQDEYPDGTTGALINYYRKTYNLDFNTTNDIYEKISKGVRK